MIDTCSIIQNFVNDEPTSDLYKQYKKKPELQKKLWSRLCNLDNQIFKSYQPKKKKKLYDFHHLIRTDGVSLCILFGRLDKNGVPIKKQKDENKPCETTPYIEHSEITDDMTTKMKVAIDINFSDLIYCGAYDKNGKLLTFRYTQNQRRLETRAKKSALYTSYRLSRF